MYVFRRTPSLHHITIETGAVAGDGDEGMERGGERLREGREGREAERGERGGERRREGREAERGGERGERRREAERGGRVSKLLYNAWNSGIICSTVD